MKIAAERNRGRSRLVRKVFDALKESFFRKNKRGCAYGIIYDNSAEFNWESWGFYNKVKISRLEDGKIILGVYAGPTDKGIDEFCRRYCEKVVSTKKGILYVLSKKPRI